MQREDHRRHGSVAVLLLPALEDRVSVASGAE